METTGPSAGRIQRGMLVPMRDGIQLALDVLFPAGRGPFPIVLVRTPYDKVALRGEPSHRGLAAHGYAVAFQDVRGRFDSDGEFFPYFNDRDDGHDTVEWLARQEWSNGAIGMAGRSYAGQTQWLAASAEPAHLRAIVPTCSPPDLFLNEPILNGIFLLPMAEWMVKMGRRSFDASPFLQDLFVEHQPYFDVLPLASVPATAGTSSPWWDEMMQHPNLDEFWRRGSYQDAWGRIAVPALNIAGWYDMNLPGTLTNFTGMRREGATETARSGQRLIVGPWHHLVNRDRVVNGVDFGPEALVDLEASILRFYERWLKGPGTDGDDDPVRVFVMGANEWWTGSDWPLPADFMRFFLHSGGRANSSGGDGVLSAVPPGAEPPDRYHYDPLDPVYALWRLRDGPVDDSAQAGRQDVLCYTSAELTQRVDVIGPVTISLVAASSALDTDWHARLVDVQPDGSSRFLCHGALRARFRESLSEPSLLEPARPYVFAFGLDATANSFLPGHRIRLEVTSSWFPRYERNTNSGAENNFLDANPVVATQTVFHEQGKASHLVLPIISRAPP
jgi:putative CocE/NonD family hydrolase